MKNIIIKNLIILGVIIILLNISGCVEQTGLDRFYGTWEITYAPEIVMHLNEDGTTNVWNDPELAERVGDNYTSSWSLKDDDWIIFRYNFTTYEKNFRFKYRFEDNGNLILIDTAYNIEFPFKKV